jgi:hypothetical protein
MMKSICDGSKDDGVRFMVSSDANEWEKNGYRDSSEDNIVWLIYTVLVGDVLTTFYD